LPIVSRAVASSTASIVLLLLIANLYSPYTKSEETEVSS
jgi:hypothetical protein